MRTHLALLLWLAAAPAAAERIKDLAAFAGVRSNSLVGYGLVVGLAGTGDDNLDYAAQAMRNAVQRMGLTLPPGGGAGLKNSAAVIVTAELPAFAKPGQRVDVTVSALGKAKSLRGGTLLLTALRGADGEAYATAQGSLAVGGLGVEGADGSKIVINVPSAGRIPGGGTVERAVDSGFADAPALVLNLHEADASTARAVAAAIEAALGPGRAAPLDAVSIRIDAPPGAAARIALMSRIENLDVAAARPPARVVVNARTGTVVVGGDVRVLPAAVAHGSLAVRIDERLNVSQPAPLGRGETVVTPESRLAAAEQPGRLFPVRGASLDELVRTINAIGASPGDLVAILEALKQAGALRAELVVI